MNNCLFCHNKIYAKNLCLKHYQQQWQKTHKANIKRACEKYRKKHIDLCRKRTRDNQILLNNKHRFGGMRIKALERDTYTCQNCGKDISGKNMSCVHHINHNKKDNRMENFISLCKSCHALHHMQHRISEKNG